MSASLVGSEMCIRDSAWRWPAERGKAAPLTGKFIGVRGVPASARGPTCTCLLYTSDAADDM
eukprot:10685970-Alexandrium_andersonii.AAC.1